MSCRQKADMTKDDVDVGVNIAVCDDSLFHRET